jgi:putative transposase
MQSAFKFRIYPTKEQETFLAIQFGHARYIYNHFLNRRQTEWKTNKKTLNYNACSAELTSLKTEFPWLSEANSQSLQASIRNLDTAYVNFFEHRAKYPKSKRKHSDQCVKVPQNFAIEGKLLHIPKLQTGIRIRVHRQPVGKQVALFIRKTKTGKFFASILCEYERQSLPRNENKLGLDLGLLSLIAMSNGFAVANPRWLKRLKRKLTFLHRQLSRKQKGSENRNKARHQLALVYEKITNSRLNFLHQLTRKIVNENQIIVSETLSVKNMMKNHCLAESIQDAAWGELVRQLGYKSDWGGRTFVKIDRFFPSSKICNHCKEINHELQLDQREWVCSHCEQTNNRDVNAAKNILEEGLKILNTLASERSTEPKQKLAETPSSVERRKSRKQDGSKKQEAFAFRQR